GTNGRIAQFLLGKSLGGFARDEERFEAIDFLKGHVVGSPCALAAAGGFIELLLRNELRGKHLLRAGVFSVGVKEICFGAFHGGDLFGVSRDRVIKADAELRPYLLDNASLALDLKFELLWVQHDQRLALGYRVADVSQDLRNASFHLCAKSAFFERK